MSQQSSIGIIANLSRIHQVIEVKSRLENIIHAADELVKKNDPKDDIYSLKEIGSYAIGFNLMIEEITVTSDAESRVAAVIERAELFCSIAERACQHVKH